MHRILRGTANIFNCFVQLTASEVIVNNHFVFSKYGQFYGLRLSHVHFSHFC